MKYWRLHSISPTLHSRGLSMASHTLIFLGWTDWYFTDHHCYNHCPTEWLENTFLLLSVLVLILTFFSIMCVHLPVHSRKECIFIKDIIHRFSLFRLLLSRLWKWLKTDSGLSGSGKSFSMAFCLAVLSILSMPSEHWH